MKHYETIFTAENGFKASANIFEPANGSRGHTSFSIKAPDDSEWNTPIVFQLPYAMADKAKRIAAAINEIMNSGDDVASKIAAE